MPCRLAVSVVSIDRRGRVGCRHAEAAADALATRVQERAAREPAFATVLEAILEAPTADSRELTHVAAQQVNDVRRQQALAEFREGSLSTAEVRERLGPVERAVRARAAQPWAAHRAHHRQRHLVPRLAAPGRRLRADLPQLLDALGRFTDDAVAADRVMRLRRDELGGKSLAAALDDPKRAATAWNLLGALGRLMPWCGGCRSTGPTGLSLLGLPTGSTFWRIDAEPPERWTWEGFPSPRHRFDPADGSFRTRYASTRFYGAARERYLDSGRYIPAAHADHHVVPLVATRPFRVLDLRNEQKLDLLDLDDRISTSHEPKVWEAAHLLAQRAHGWWDRIDGIVYRARTTPVVHLQPRRSGRSTGARRRRGRCGTAPRSSTTSSSAATSRSTSTGLGLCHR